MLMTIDLLPTIARLAGAELPAHPIDGLDVWPLLAGQPGAKNPHEAYLFYYEKNELQAVASGDGRWKLQLPHIYSTLAGRPGGRGGTPSKYEKRTLERPELYDLPHDVGETSNVGRAAPRGRRSASSPSPSGPGPTSAIPSRSAWARAHVPRGASTGRRTHPRRVEIDGGSLPWTSERRGRSARGGWRRPCWASRPCSGA